jgi:hypothetical protein
MGNCETKQIADLARSDDHSNAGGEARPDTASARKSRQPYSSRP